MYCFRKVFRLVISVSIVIVLLFSSCNTYRRNITHRNQWWLECLKLDNLDAEYNGKGVTVAIIDGGVDFSHPDLQHVVHEEIKTVREIKEDSFGLSHGTAIAGIIAAMPHTSTGLLGIAPAVKLLSIDVTDDEDGLVNPNDFVHGIQEAMRNKADVINISISFSKDMPQIKKVIEEAYDLGIIIIASINNNGTICSYPSDYPEVIAVGSYDKKYRPINNYSPQKTVFFLPGENIVTTKENKEYASYSGTSFSAPILSGIVALIIQQNRNISTQDIVFYLKDPIVSNVDKLIKKVKRSCLN